MEKLSLNCTRTLSHSWRATEENKLKDKIEVEEGKEEKEEEEVVHEADKLENCACCLHRFYIARVVAGEAVILLEMAYPFGSVLSLIQSRYSVTRVYTPG